MDYTKLLEQLNPTLQNHGVQISPEMAEFFQTEEGVKAQNDLNVSFENWRKKKHNLIDANDFNELKKENEEIKELLTKLLNKSEGGIINES